MDEGKRETRDKGREERRDVLHDFGGDRFARAAPGREEIDDHEGVLFGQGAVEFRLAGRIKCVSGNVLLRYEGKS